MKGESTQKVGKMVASFILDFTNCNCYLGFCPGCFWKGLRDHASRGHMYVTKGSCRLLSLSLSFGSLTRTQQEFSARAQIICQEACKHAET